MSISTSAVLNASSLVSLVRLRAEQEGQKKAFVFLKNRGKVEEPATYAELDQRARLIGGFLQGIGRPGDRVLLFYLPDLEYVAAFLGVMYAGRIPVPLYPPRPNQKLLRVARIIEDCGAQLALTTTATLPKITSFLELDDRFHYLQVAATDELDLAYANRWQPPKLDSGSLAFLQYTSGSTGTPKGVMVSHGNLMANERSIAEAFETTSDDVCLNWLPLYHDMGLIGAVLQPLYRGFTSYLLPSIDFVRDPMSWLQGITRYKATLCGSPNFGYELCVSRLTPAILDTLDLRSWRVAFNGAEPVRSATLNAFAQAFEPAGFRASNFYPTYGMAEATLFMTGGKVGHCSAPTLFSDEALKHNHALAPSTETDGVRELVSCGWSDERHTVKIVNPESMVPCIPGQIGEIWFNGPSKTLGYWQKPELTNQAFNAYIADSGEGPFLRTGDLGFIYEGNIFITGRCKDLIIIRGLNHYPQDLELTSELTHPACVLAGSAAFTVEEEGEERLVIAQEVQTSKIAGKENELIALIRGSVSEAHELVVHSVSLVRKGSLPKTSSGKIQRHACRQLYLDGELSTLASNVLEIHQDDSAMIVPVLPESGPERRDVLATYMRGLTAKILGVDATTIIDAQPLTQLGLNSLQFIQFAQRLEQDFGLILPVTHIMEGKSLEALVGIVAGLHEKSSGESVTATVPDRFPLSYNQRSMWFLQCLNPESSAYNIYFALETSSNIDQAQMRAALKSLVNQHRVLRTGYNLDFDTPVQFESDVLPSLEVIQTREMNEKSLKQTLNETATRPFDLTAGVPLRIVLFQQPDNDLLLVCLHHIAVDFWSILVMMDELLSLYTTNNQTTIPPREKSYYDFVNAQQRYLNSHQSVEDLAYWSRELGTSLPVLDLPIKGSRPRIKNYQGASIGFSLDREETHAIQTCARALETTPFSVLLAVYMVLLHRLSNQDDLVVGIPTTGRPSPDFAEVVGYFVNPIAIRAQLGNNHSFGHYAQQIRRKVIDGMHHGAYPLAKLVEHLCHTNESTQSPLFQAMFVLQVTHRMSEATPLALGSAGTRACLHGMDLSSYPLMQRSAQFDLTLMMVETEQGYDGIWEYAEQLFDAETIGRCSHYFRRLVQLLAANPETMCSEAMLLSPAERALILEDFNCSAAVVVDQPVLAQVISRAKALPEALAMEHCSRLLTYRQLDAWSDQLAEQITAHGGGPESIVALCMPRSPEFVIAALAILKAGAAYLPMDRYLPEHRLSYMLADSKATLLITRKNAAPEHGTEIREIHLDPDCPDLGLPARKGNRFNQKPSPQSLAYVIYTSGSTGRPKGVAISHGTLANLVAWHQHAFEITAQDRASMLAGLGFDAAVWEIWPYLTSGACLIIPDELLTVQPEALRDWLLEMGVTIGFLATPLMERMLALEWPTNGPRILLTGGDKLTQYPRKDLGFHLINNYGPTENTVVATSALISPDADATQPPMIGKPIANTTGFVLNPKGLPCPQGISGEFCIGGNSLARGYLHAASQTASAFRPNPYAKAPGQRLYHTGDLVRQNGRGELAFMGRIDHQIQLRGYRIELGEIETLLLKHKHVSEAVVHLREGSAGKSLTAYVVPVNGAKTYSEQLLHSLAEELPEYMVPTAVVFLDIMPLTPNGKVDREALPVPKMEAAGRIDPRTHFEAVIAGFFVEILGCAQPSIDVSFFALGGHSLAAAQVIARINETFEVNLPVRGVFEASTVRNLTALVEQAVRGPRNVTERIAPSQAVAFPPLSHEQRQLWYLEQLTGPSATYNLAVAYRLLGRLNIDALEQSLHQIVAIHPALRTRFPLQKGEPYQAVVSNYCPIIGVIDINALGQEDRELRLSTLARIEEFRPFDLTNGPCIRATLIRLNSQDHQLMISLHHIVADGWSVGLLLQDLAQAYRADGTDEAAKLEAPPITYVDYALWQDRWLADNGERLAKFWRTQLEDAPPVLQLAMAAQRPAIQSYAGAALDFQLSEDLFLGLQKLAGENRTSLFMVLLAGFKMVLRLYSGSNDLVIGTPVANRGRRETEAVVGYFVNTLPLRTMIRETAQFTELLSQITQSSLDAFNHEELPFEKMVEMLNPERVPGCAPIFQIMFSMLDDGNVTPNLGNLEVHVIEGARSTAKLDLTLVSVPRNGGLLLSLEYNTDLYGSKDIQHLGQHLVSLFNLVARDPSRPVQDFELLSEHEKTHLLRDLSMDTEVVYSPSILANWAEAVARFKDSEAIFDPARGTSLSYAAMNELADRFALQLRAVGIVKESLVGILLPRSCEMVAAMIGCFKIGAAYVPFSINDPADRLEFVAADCGLAALITEESIDSVSVPKIGINPPTFTKLAADVELDPGCAAYVIYTSGSTGRPKGVVVSHKSLSNLVSTLAGVYEITQHDRALQFAAASFDVACEEIYPTLIRGACLTIAPETLKADVTLLSNFIEEQRISLLNLPSDYWQEWVLCLQRKGSVPDSLRLVVAGSSKVMTARLETWNHLVGDRVEWFTAYGPTECTVTTVIGRGTGPKTAVVPIGRPVANTYVYILDRQGRLLPLGCPGQLCIGGPSVTRGYLNKPSQTAAVFCPDPFTLESGCRLYLTGDLARFNQAGELCFLGRVDHQVKLRGFRIEPGEVDALLLSQPSVRAALTLVNEELQQLVSYVVTDQGLDSSEMLKGFLAKQLPNYMVPAAVVCMERFPLMSSDKINVRALPKPMLDQGDLDPRQMTPTQQVLSRIMADILQLPTVGLNGHFFDLGGHSLSATRLIAAVVETFNVALPVSAVFEAPRLADFAQRVISTLDARNGAVVQPLLPRPTSSPAPLSFAQSRLWFLNQMEGSSATYNVHASLELNGILSVSALENALYRVLARHEVMRSSFPMMDGEPVQFVSPVPNFNLTVINADKPQVGMLARIMASRPFDLADGPLFRAYLIRTAPTCHILLATMHHIISDGWSVGLFLQETTAFYRHALTGTGPTPAPLSVQYADFAIWQRTILTDAHLKAQVDFWRSHLQGAPALLEIPLDFRRPKLQTHHGAIHHFELLPQTTANLVALCRKTGTTVFMATLALYQILLARYSRAQNVVVGTPVANRERKEIEGLLGFFVNTLALKLDLSGKPNFHGVLAQVRKTQPIAYTHAELPFEKLVEELKPHRSESYSPIFQAMFVMEDNPFDQVDMLGIEVKILEEEVVHALFDLTLGLELAGDRYKAYWKYNTDLFEPQTIERMRNHFLCLIEDALVRPDVPVDDLNLSSDGEREALLHAYNDTQPTEPVLPRTGDWLVHWAEQAPKALALAQIDGSEQVNYGTLARRVDGLVERILALGVRPDDFVGLCLPRSTEMITALLAIHRCGAALLPLDPDYPRERLDFMISDSGMSALLTNPALAKHLPLSDQRVILLDGTYSESSTDFRVPIGAPESAAYLLYTSGSTGVPKGVVVSHHALSTYVRACVDIFEMGPSDRVLQFTSINFDVAINEIFAPIKAGAAVIPRDQEMLVSPQTFMDAVARCGITRLSLATSYFHELSRAVYLDQCHIPPCLKLVMFAGERAKPEWVSGWFEKLGDQVKLINGYGPTEATVVSVAATLDPTMAFAYREVPIGVPMADERAYIMDHRFDIVPAGLLGELFIGGDCIARGYHRRPSLTAQRFVPDPFAQTPGARVYRTGDLVRLRSDNQIEFLGRTDRQVKFNGFRIELGEIEAALTSHEGVDQAVVLAQTTRSGESRLAAYVVLKHDKASNADDWRTHLRAILPEFMVPGIFLELASIPLNPNGKIDHTALPTADWGLDREQTKATTPTEGRVARLFSELLDLPTVDLQQSFFDMGGHSLLATRLIARIREQFTIDLPMRTIFDEPSVSGLSQWIEDALRRQQDVPNMSLHPEQRPDRIPCSFAQTRLWFLDHLEGTDGLYNVPSSLSLTGWLDVSALKRSLQSLFQRHESLRTRFVDELGVAYQSIDEQAASTLVVVDLSALSGARLSAVADKITHDEVNRPFDLTSGPLARTTLLRMGADAHCLILTLHHIITDGWSMAVFVRELVENYVGGPKGAGEARAPMTLQYADYALWQIRHLQGKTIAKQHQYWARKLAGAPALLELPTDRSRPAQQDYRGNLLHFTLPRQDLQGLEKLSKANDATLFMGLLAVLDLVLFKYSHQDDIVIGTPVANREQSALEDIIGLFVNTLALRVQLSGNPTFFELLQRTRTTALEAYAHQNVPFEQLLDGLRIPRDLSHAPVFQVMLVLQNLPSADFDIPGLEIRENDLEIVTSKFDLTLTIKDEGSTVKGWLEYSEALFDRDTAVRVVQHFNTLLTAVVSHPEHRLSRLEMITQEEKTHICEVWNQTRRPYPDNHTLHGLFEQQVQRTPDAVALGFDDGKDSWLTYAEMSRRTDALAYKLRTMGVKTDTLVGLCMERSLEMVISIYAVLKAGGAYVPVDPDYPRDRIEFMLHDANVTVLITQPHLQDQLPDYLGILVAVDSGEPCDAWGSGVNIATSPHQLAYMIFTSGSSGRPKGVMVAHQAICNRLHWMQNEYVLTAEDVVMQKTPFSFDVSVWELFWPLHVGARLVIAKPNGHRNPDYLLDLIERSQVTTLHFVPSMLQAFITADPRDSGHLRRVFCSGEALPQSLADQANARFAASFHNLYGPTEAAVDVTYWPCDEPSPGETLPIGRPIDNTTLYMVDSHANLVPPKVGGELLIGGVNLARGYLNRPALTAEKFIPNPFGAHGQRLYRSGDLANFTADGIIEYSGRIDHQVKIRGMRLELGEIEACLRECAGVSDAVVLARKMADSLRLVAYLSGSFEEQPLTATLKKHLPEYMIPSHILRLEAFPLLPNGKINRRALAAMPIQEQASSARIKAPHSPNERLVAEIWQDLLKPETISVHHTFFQLGGDSILSIQLTSRLREAGFVIRVEDIFNHQTLEDLAQFLDQDRPAEPSLLAASAPFDLIDASDRAALPDGVVDAYPLSHLQAGMLYHGIMAATTAVYHDVFSFHLRCPYDPASMELAVRALLARHPALRTSFAMAGYTHPLQLVWSQVTPALNLHDISDHSDEGQTELVAQYIRGLQQAELDWRKPPLIRFHLMRRGAHHVQLLIDLHHAILDGWSISLLLTELMRDYLSLVRRGELAHIPEVSTAYRDFVAAESLVLSSKAAELFWNQTLGDAEYQPFPSGKKSTAPETERDIQVLNISFPKHQTQALQQLVESEGIGIKTLLFCIHLKAVAAMYGRIDVTSGMVTHGRLEVPDGERVLGLFLNSLPFRMRLARGSWRQLAAAVHKAEQRLLNWRRFPMGELVRRMGNPLFDVLFNFTSFQMFRMFEGEKDFEVLDSQGFEFTNFTLYILFNLEGADHLTLSLSYDRNLVPTDRAELLKEAYLCGLAAMTSAPDAPHEAGPLMTDASLKRLSTLARPTQQEPFHGTFESHHCIHHLFEQRARAQGSTVAVCGSVGGKPDDTRESLTYTALHLRVHEIAGRLQQLRVGPETIVGIFCNRHPNLVAGLLGILKAGGAYLPMDPKFPADRLAYMVEDSGVDLILVDKDLAHFLPQTRARLIYLEDLLESTGTQVAPNGLTPDNRAYVIYTSGSTGKPKGVEVTHRTVVNFLHAMERAPGLFANDILVGITTISFDIAALELYLPLMVGATLVLADSETTADPTLLGRLLNESQATAMQATPATWRMLNAAGWQQPQGFKMLCGGEALPVDLAGDLLANGGDLWNLYGPTETTIWSATTRITSMTQDQAGAMPIGRPITETALYILDEHLNLALPGVAGELFIGGSGLARGYSGQSALTAQRFLPDPLGRPSSRMYRTGDLVHQLADGALVYLRRLDHQVKLRGYRIELGEIETAINLLDGIEQCVVMIREDTPSDQRLVAYFVLRNQDSAPNADQIAKDLRRHLPEYMVPTHFVPLASFPMTANGKVDRKAMPALDIPEAEVGDAATAPQTPTEELIGGLFSKLLGVPVTNRNSDFFRQGGHSLLATQLMAHLQKAFRVEIPLRDLYRLSTIRGLARYIENAQKEGKGFSEPPIVPLTHSGPRLLSFAQQRLWFQYQLDPVAAVYNIPNPTRISGTLNVSALIEGLSSIVARHESLRTVYRQHGYDAIQEVVPASPLKVDYIDISRLEAPLRQATLMDLLRRENRRPFDLGEAPMIRASLTRLSPDEHVLLNTIHHIAVDGWSLGIMRKEMATFYETLSSGEPFTLPPSTLQYSDFSEWQRGYMQGEVLQRHVDYWRNQLKDAPHEIKLPLDKPRPRVPRYVGTQHLFTLNESISSSIKELSLQQEVTYFVTFMSAYGLLLSHFSGQSTVLVATDVANRNRAEIEDIIGFFVNQLIFKVEVDHTLTFTELMHKISEVAIDAYTYQDLPFEKIVEILNPPRTNIAPFAQAKLVLQNANFGTIVISGLSLEPIPSDRAGSQLDISLTLVEKGPTFYGHIEYDVDLFVPNTIQQWAGLFETLLVWVSENPMQTCRELTLRLEQEDKKRKKERAAGFQTKQGGFRGRTAKKVIT